MRYITFIVAAIWAPAVYAAAEDTVSPEFTDFKGSSVEPPEDIFLAKRDRTHELAGVSLPEIPGLGLEARQGQCPYPVMCSSRSCCPSGYKCCNAGAPPLCCPSAYACRLDVNNCCPDTAVTCGKNFCAKPGSICCGESICQAGTECNTNGGTTSCCQPGELKCLGTYVDPNHGRHLKSDIHIQDVRNGVRPPTDAPSAATSTTSPSRGARTSRPNCVYECHNGQMLPVVEVPNVAGQTDQLFLSMCSGILGTSSGRSGDGSNFDVLTYKGADGKALRRSQARCKGYCAKQKAVFGDPNSLQCDEYPPAMAGEGGKGAFRVCIPYSQNSGAQSKLFRRFVSDCSPGKGKQFIVRMKGGCKVRNDRRDLGSNQNSIAARADNHEATFKASSNALYSWDNMTYMYVPLQELQNGHYSIDVKIEGQVRGLQILDSDGEEHYTAGGAVSNSHTVEFDITDADVEGEEPDPVPAGLFLDIDEAVGVSYVAKATLNNTQSGQDSGAAYAFGGPLSMAWGTGLSLLLAVLVL
ncbi:hypothetical protein NLG97_g4072 [Lecanicillium saksenae]|uniref:Uncharacterized protein n=1 Tax=Lecanicillium saksenae TaxID=468837 RepID=A0ACC1QZH9_9HYPO|nr:hypothetical protein NLG97_g4072 [Lecanicillium saksenae]